MNLYVDEKKTDEIHTAAFIIKGLEKGTHTISLELLHNDSSKYHLKKRGTSLYSETMHLPFRQKHVKI
ncbi:hypothetical protein MGI18_11980 [Bacillus sp. OVS6]|nr:hypothetical protein MGI18_11980 [Bacillus sp. OVS6]